MEYKLVKLNNLNLHILKTDQFKTSKIDVIFSSKATKENLYKRTFLSNIMNYSSKEYPTKRSLAIKLEDLYKAYYYGFSARIGGVVASSFTINFIDPKFIKEKDYLESIVEFLSSMIINPNQKDKSFDFDSFKIVKKNILMEIDSIKENPSRYALTKALKEMDKNSFASLNLLGDRENLEKITPEKLYDEYESMIKNSNIDIFVMGNFDERKIINLIKKYFKKLISKDKKLVFYDKNKTKRKVLKKEEKSSFMQSQLVYIYNLENLNTKEKEVVVHLFNYIFGSGGLTSKLYKYIREENNFCYHIGSSYYKNDNLLIVETSLSKENINKCIKLIDKSLLEMQKGEFSSEDLTCAIENMKMSLTLANNSLESLMRNYKFNVYTKTLLIPDKIKLIDSVTKDDIINVAKKIKKNTIYILNEADNEEN